MIRLIRSRILTEDIESVRKNYPNISDEKFTQLIALDPTFKADKNSVGTYGKWILNLYNKGKLREDDFYKVTEYLTKFDDYKKDIEPSKRDIGLYKTLPDLFAFLSATEEIFNDEGRGLTDRQKLRRKQTAARNADIDADKVYEDADWIVYVPKTYEASCKLGNDTEWCTATTADDSYYNQYSKEGPLFINISKHDPEEKYQFHFQSQQFMDTDDRPIDLWDFLADNAGLNNFYSEQLDELLNIDEDDRCRLTLSAYEVAQAICPRSYNAQDLYAMLTDNADEDDIGIYALVDEATILDVLNSPSLVTQGTRDALAQYDLDVQSVIKQLESKPLATGKAIGLRDLLFNAASSAFMVGTAGVVQEGVLNCILQKLPKNSTLHINEEELKVNLPGNFMYEIFFSGEYDASAYYAEDYETAARLFLNYLYDEVRVSEEILIQEDFDIATFNNYIQDFIGDYLE